MYYVGRLSPILYSQFELWIKAFELKVNLQLWSWMLIRIENKKICTKNINYVYKIFFSVLGRPFVMAACLKNGDILLLRSYDDVIPQVSTAIYFSCKIYLQLTLMFIFILEIKGSYARNVYIRTFLKALRNFQVAFNQLMQCFRKEKYIKKFLMFSAH